MIRLFLSIYLNWNSNCNEYCTANVSNVIKKKVLFKLIFFQFVWSAPNIHSTEIKRIESVEWRTSRLMKLAFPMKYLSHQKGSHFWNYENVLSKQRYKFILDTPIYFIKFRCQLYKLLKAKLTHQMQRKHIDGTVWMLQIPKTVKFIIFLPSKFLRWRFLLLHFFFHPCFERSKKGFKHDFPHYSAV